VGGPTNPLLKDGLTTVIGGGPGAAGALANALRRTAGRAGGNEDRALLAAFRAVGRLADALGLVRSVRDRACELYKDVADAGRLRGRGQAAVSAALVYVACRQEGHPRSFKEICEACPPGSVDKRDVGRAYKALVRELEAAAEANGGGGGGAGGGAGGSAAGGTSVVGPVAVVSAAHLARRFCSRLGLPPAVAKAAEDMAEAACPRDGVRPGGNAVKPWDGQSPLSQAAAVILAITRLPSCPAEAVPIPPDIAGIAGVTDATMRVAARNMWPSLLELVPPGFASAGEVRALMEAGVP
jgi:transcription initiation factor TFIIB